MKKVCLLISIIIIISTLAACGSKEDTTPTIATKIVTDKSGELITTANKNTAEVQTITETDTNGNTIVKTQTTTKKSNIKTTTTVAHSTKVSYESELCITYKNLEDMRIQVAKYSTFDKMLELGKVKYNNNVSQPFVQDNYLMIFSDKQYYIPYLPKGYTLKNCGLSAKGYFYFNFINKDKKKEYLKIYTNTYYDQQKTNKYTLKFKNSLGLDIYKNSDGLYCWFQNDKYVTVYSGNSKDFVNDVRFEINNINR